MSTTPLVRLEQEGNVLIVTPLFTTGTGSLTGVPVSDAELHAQWAIIERTLRDSAIEHVTIDLGETPYFGSLMLEWMVLIWKRIRARDGQLVICHCSEVGREILTAARFDTIWKICDDRAGALAALV